MSSLSFSDYRDPCLELKVSVLGRRKPDSGFELVIRKHYFALHKGVQEIAETFTGLSTWYNDYQVLRPPKGFKKWNPPNMNPLLHWGN